MRPTSHRTLTLGLFLPACLASFWAGNAGSYPLALDRARLGDPPEAIQEGGADVVHYGFHLALTDDSNRIQGRAEITVRFLDDGLKEMALDLVGKDSLPDSGMMVEAVRENGAAVDYVHSDDRLIMALSTPSAAQEVRTFEVSYEGTPADGFIIGENLHGRRTFFGDNWPDRARYWLPTVDRPGDKATVEWTVRAPARYQVVGNGMLVERELLTGGMALTRWKSAVALPTKVMVVGVAEFAVDTLAVLDGIPIVSWTYPEDRAKGVRDFALAENAVRFFRDYVGPFPFEKLANVQSTTRYGGMENASAIFYAERAVRGDRRNESLIVHETAHQWFGDSVTEATWPHIWLSEGFATYLTHLYREQTYGREALVAGMEADRRTVIRFHSARPGLPLIPGQLTDPEEMLNPNAYQKGAWVLHMLRREIGDERFQAAVREFYRRFRDINASSSDFESVVEEEAGRDLSWFFEQWTREAGHPLLSTEWTFDAEGGRLTLTVTQLQDGGSSFRFPLDLAVESRSGTLTRLGTVQITDREQTFSFPLSAEPHGTVLDPDVWLLFEEARVPG